jgi:2-amino-4-hydroxy-6-hydroxymethyldihydropteridine diphosphokinase
MLRNRHTVHIGLGSNLGDRKAYLVRGLKKLWGPELQLRRVSSLYETAPVGPVADQPSFLNAVAEVETTLPPRVLLAHCQTVELALGRKRLVDKGPRTLDLDLLLYDDLILKNARLTIPHAELTARAFVLIPLLELCPMAVDPRDGALLCRYADWLLRRQSIVKLGSLPGFRARHRLPTRHSPPDEAEEIADRRSGSIPSLA